MGEITVNKNKIFIVNRPGTATFSIPLLWASAKTYYEENSKHSAQWEWGTPDLNYNDFDQLLSFLISEKPTVIGFSLYVWNETFSLKLAKELKDYLKDTIIVVGGPQADIQYNPDYFKLHPYIDLVIPSDAYGERSILDILDTVTESTPVPRWNNLQYSYYPDSQCNIKFNSLAPKKREFKWPSNPFRAQESYIKSLINKFDHSVMILIETSRGCPYKCSFCDWGGGVFTKVVKKEFATVLDEITWSGENRIDMLSFTDANFGAFDIDIEYTKHLIAVNKKYGFPKYVKIQPTKSKIHNLFKIYSLLADANMLSHYQISIQDLDDNVKKNVDRIDFSFEEQISMFHNLQKHKYLPIIIEMILGLPGSTLDTIKDSIHKISLEKLSSPVGHFWALLPTTPAYNSVYREKYKLVTVNGKTSYGSDAGGRGVREKSIDLTDDTTTEFVVGTFSYTTDDWIKMHLLQIFTASVQGTEILNLIADYLWQEYNIKYGDFFDTCLQTLLTDQQVDQTLQHDIILYRNKLLDWLDGSIGDLYIDYCKEFPFVISPSIYYLFLILTQTDEFFKGILLSISKLIPISDEIIDLCKFSKNRLKDITYRPGKIFTTEYDWPKYIKTTILEKSPKIYQLLDNSIDCYGHTAPLDHIQYPLDSVEYIVEYIELIADANKGKKIVDQMIEI